MMSKDIKALPCITCGYKLGHRPESIDDEILRVKMGISQASTRIKSGLDAYYDVDATKKKLSGILKHLENVKAGFKNDKRLRPDEGW